MSFEIISHIDYMLSFLIKPDSLESLERLQLKNIYIKKCDEKLFSAEVLIEKNLLNQEMIITSQIKLNDDLIYKISIVFFVKGMKKYYLHHDLPNLQNTKLLVSFSKDQIIDIQKKFLKDNEFFEDIELQKLLNQKDMILCMQGIIMIILDGINENFSEVSLSFYENSLLDKLQLYCSANNQLFIEQNDKIIAFALTK